MLRKLGWTLAAVALAGVLGWGSALLRLRWFVGLGDIEIGPWQTSTKTGSAQADALLRAAIAVNAILAMNREQAIYFVARTDSAGHRLDGRCRYRVTGSDPDSRWWSLTVYGSDRFLVPNAEHRYSASRESVTRDADGRYAVRLSRQRPEGLADGDWAALPEGAFLLTLRLYQPSPAVTADTAHVKLPEIVAEACA